MTTPAPNTAAVASGVKAAPGNVASGTKAAASTASNATGLNKSIHGVPMWGWIGLGVAAMFGMSYMKKASANKAAATKAAANTTQEGAGMTTTGYIAPTTTSETTAITTNQEWATAAEADLIQKGNNGTAVTAAVQDYVNNEQLTTAQQTMIDTAVQDIGPLPSMSQGQSNVGTQLLDQPMQGNLLGQLAYSAAGIAGLNDPSNQSAQYIDPFVNDVIDAGPISGLFDGANSILGGNASVSGTSPSINIPGFGNVSFGGTASNQELSGTATGDQSTGSSNTSTTNTAADASTATSLLSELF